MRQNYIYKTSNLDDFHNQIVFFFESIYFQSLTPYSNWNDNFIHYKLKPILSKCKKLQKLLEIVHMEYLTIGAIEQKLVYESALNSCEIEAICNANISIANKQDLSQDIGNAIHNLYQYLYYQLPTNKCFIDIYGSMKTHYEVLKTVNKKIKKCPFCGLQNIYPLKNKTKQTYDHYIPLSHYPFIGIQFKNLVPTCKDCNEDFKHDKDSLFVNVQRTIRRKLFYPYKNYNYSLNINLSNVQLNLSNLKIISCKVKISCSKSNFQNQMQSWEDIYEINSRYENTIINDSEEWFDEFYEYKILKTNRGTFIDNPTTFLDFMDSLRVQESTSMSFLKSPYFDTLNNLTNVFK